MFEAHNSSLSTGSSWMVTRIVELPAGNGFPIRFHEYFDAFNQGTDPHLGDNHAVEWICGLLVVNRWPFLNTTDLSIGVLMAFFRARSSAVTFPLWTW